MRGTFANIRIKNQMVPGVEGGVTIHYPSGERMLPIYDAAMRKRRKACRSSSSPARNTAPARRATGRPRARGCSGVRAVIAQSFERIHRSNLVGMGVLPLQFLDGESWQELGLRGDEIVIDRRHRRRSEAARAAARSRSRTPTAIAATSRCCAASIRSTSSITSAMAASCPMCCGTSPGRVTTVTVL